MLKNTGGVTKSYEKQKGENMTEGTVKPHYGYYSLYMFAALSAIIFVIGLLITVLV
jgi:hypothetical protein